MGFDNLADLLGNILKYFLIFSGVAIFGSLIYSGFLFATSKGQPDNVTKARISLTYSIVGIIVVAIAYLMVNFIVNKVK